MNAAISATPLATDALVPMPGIAAVPPAAAPVPTTAAR